MNHRILAANIGPMMNESRIVVQPIIRTVRPQVGMHALVRNLIDKCVLVNR